MSNLLLQKTPETSKSQEHQLLLEQRLDLRKNGESEKLHFEGETILKPITRTQKRSKIVEISRKFKQLMQKCNINTALNLLTNNMGLGILPLDQKTTSQLVLKNPQKSCLRGYLNQSTNSESPHGLI